MDDSLYVLFNAHHESLPFTLPEREWDQRWVKVLETNESIPQESEQLDEAGQQVPVEARSPVVLRHVTCDLCHLSPATASRLRLR